MINPKVQASPQFKHEFWEVIVDCLVELHGFPLLQARTESNKLRALIEAPPSGIDSEIFYHSEPFDIAYDIAEPFANAPQKFTKGKRTKRQEKYLKCRQRYEDILRQRNWR